MTKTTEGETIARRIENIRNVQRRSVAWLASVTGMADKTLRRRLVAPEQFSLAELSSIATALGTNLEHLVTGAAGEHTQELAA
jgi:DNA-binding phage protein